MSRLLWTVTASLFLAAALAGCSASGTPQVESVKAPESDPIAEVKTILTNYTNGMPVTSEASSFPDLIARVKAKDAAKGEALQKGLNEIQANPASAKAKAQELLRKL